MLNEKTGCELSTPTLPVCYCTVLHQIVGEKKGKKQLYIAESLKKAIGEINSSEYTIGTVVGRNFYNEYKNQNDIKATQHN